MSDNTQPITVSALDDKHVALCVRCVCVLVVSVICVHALLCALAHDTSDVDIVNLSL